MCICVWVCTHVCGSPWRPESLVSQELELQVAVSEFWEPTWVLCRSSWRSLH